MSPDQECTLRDERLPVSAGLVAAGFADAKEVGRGGFGVVYRCSQAGLDRVVAVKVLVATFTDQRARFVREQQAMGRLTGHPNIVAVFQVGELAGGQPFLVMPFCENGSMQDRIARLTVLPLDEVLRIGVKLAGALTSAHRQGIVHRDVKPGNILLTEYGEPALCDFGISRVSGAFQTGHGVFAGSPAFLAPEVIGGGPADAAADVYGLGASLFAALTGHAAFERHTGEQVVAQFLRIASGPMPDLRERGFPDDVADVISAAMARDPHQRPSALNLGQQLQQLQASHGLHVDEMAVRDPDGSQRRIGQSASPSSPAPGPATVGNVPAPVSGLVGREEQLARLCDLVKSARLVSVTGIGGIGKTSLATHAARDVRRDFSDGVWLVELAELRDPTLLTEVLSAALGVREQPGCPLSDSLVGFLATRRVLLVLDNCEHLIDDVAKLTEFLLRDCPGLHVLTTTREALDIEGEAILALAPLPCPAPGDEPPLHALSAYDAVTLFVKRARTALPDFALTEANAAAVTRICARLEGVPLALELAAARMRVLSPDQIAEGLSDRFALLRRGRRDAPARQHTLASCIDWSYQLCTDAERRLWARLSVFAGSFDLPAVQHLCAGQLSATECLDVLSALVDKSIVVRTEQAAPTMRFRLLDTLRDYGHALLDSSEHRHMRRRHAEFYHQLSCDAYAETLGPRQRQWLERIGLEMPNIRESLQFSLDDNAVAALEIATNVYYFWHIRGRFGEARQWLDLALAATTLQPMALRIRGLHYAVLAAGHQGALDAATPAITQGRTLLEAVDVPTLHARIDHAEAFFALFSGEIERARDCFQRALDGTDDYLIRATSMNCMGMMLGWLGEYDEALTWQERGLALTDSRGDTFLRACAQNNLAMSLWRHGDYQRAEHLLRDAVSACAVLNEPWISAYSLETLAWIAGARHDSGRAVVLMAAACGLAGSIGTRLNPVPEMVAWHQKCECDALAALGDAEFQTAWARGDALTLKQAAAFVLTDTAIP